MRHPGILNDILFKIVYGSKSGEPLLSHLLNALLELKGDDEIVDLELLNPILEKDFIDEKGPVLDVKARDRKQRQFNVEVQLRAGIGDFAARSIFYGAKFFSEQIRRGDSYLELARTICISILDFDLLEDSKKVHSRFCLFEPEQHFALSDVFELHYVELRKFRKSKPQSLRTRFERWLYFLKFADLYGSKTVDLPESLVQEEGIQMSLERMRRAYARDEVRELIEAREKAERDEISRMRTAEARGLKKGTERGLKQGLEQGLERGRREVALGLLRQGVAMEIIENATGLSRKQIEALK